MALGGLSMEEMTAEERQAAGLKKTELALRVKGVGQFGAHAVAKNAGFEKGDIFISFDGQTKPMTESTLLAYAVQSRMPGETVSVTLLRNGERRTLSLPMQ
jgi:S1-C subfamily serine protease